MHSPPALQLEKPMAPAGPYPHAPSIATVPSATHAISVISGLSCSTRVAHFSPASQPVCASGSQSLGGGGVSTMMTLLLPPPPQAASPIRRAAQASFVMLAPCLPGEGGSPVEDNP